MFTIHPCATDRLEQVQRHAQDATSADPADPMAWMWYWFSHVAIFAGLHMCDLDPELQSTSLIDALMAMSHEEERGHGDGKGDDVARHDVAPPK